jgi:hypothetical protein
MGEIHGFRGRQRLNTKHCKFLSYVTRTMKQAIFRDQFVEFDVIEQKPSPVVKRW